MLEGLLKGLVLWLYGLILDGVSYMANSLLDVFNMDLSYFERYAPVTGDIVRVIIATGWALLLGNLVFQAMRSMATGIGFEGEDPKILFTRTFVFSFLLVASRQICDMGLRMTAIIMDLMQIPDAVSISTPDETNFGAFDSAWLLVVIVGIILIWQIIKFFFEIGERYVILAVLTIMAPLAFGMGGSKNTEDIFKGWCRMYGSMCVMMLMNVVFLKLLLSAMSTVPSGIGIIPWLIFIVAIARVGRKVDDLVCRVGLNPARTGDPLERGLPMMLTMMVVRNVSRRMEKNQENKNKPPHTSGGVAGASPPRSGPTGPMGSGGSSGNAASASSQSSSTHTASQSGTQNASQNTHTAGATGTHNAAGMAASAAAGSAVHMGGQPASDNQHTSHTSGQPANAASRPPIGRNGGKQGQNLSNAQTAGGQQPFSQGSRLGQRDGNGARPADKPANIDVEYDEPQGQNANGGAAPRPVNPNSTSPGAPNTAAKAAEQKPSRPPIQRTPRGNFPQAPVGAGVTPPTSHTTQNNSTGGTQNHSQTTQNSGNTTVAGTAGRPPSPQSATKPAGTNGSGTRPVSPPLSGAKHGAEISGTSATGATRPPIGHNSVVNNTSQESHSMSSGRNAGSPQSHVTESPPPSPSRNGAPQGTPPSPGRNTTPQSSPTAAPASPPSPGRNGAAAPQKPLPPTQGTDRAQSPAPSPGRNSAPQGAPPSPSRDTRPQSDRPAAPAAPPSPGRNEPPKHPPIGHNRKPPEVK